MGFNPLSASKEITEQYKRYISTIFHTQMDCRSAEDGKTLQEQLISELNKPGALDNGPFLQISKNYLRSTPLKNLIPDVLSELFYRLETDEIDPSRMILYEHQAKAIENIVLNDRNTVISTGTGSGKTKSFLIPALDYLFKEQENGTLCPGIRVMLIYPMNALANDQIRILRDILKNQKITYGSFTGETEEQQKKALSNYEEEYGHPPEPNEIISREAIWKTPPNILITNYAMLEHLLIKPNNSTTLFGTPGNNYWKYIILDEAHVYTGAKGSEVSLLLRRLRATLGRKEIRFILTSATLGSEDENEGVARFASTLCGCGEDDAFRSDDVIRAEYDVPEKPADVKKLDLEFYRDIFKSEDDSDDSDEFHDEIEDYLDEHHYPTTGNYSVDLYNIVKHDARIYDLYEILSNGPLNAAEVASKLDMDTTDFVSFIRVASMSSLHGNKLFDSKYHLFINAIEGAYITLKPDYHLSVHKAKTRKTEYGDCTEFQYFKFNTCVNCGGLYLAGFEKNGYFDQNINVESNSSKGNIYALISDEDESFKEDMKNNPHEYRKLCSVCKRIGVLNEANCEHDEKYQNVLKLVKEDDDKLCRCAFCQQQSNYRGILRSLYLGHDSSTAIVATSIYNELNKNRMTDKRFLSFSDNRQSAAYFATYLEDSYQNLLMHRAIYEALSKMSDDLVSFDVFYSVLLGVIKNHDLSGEPEKDAWLALLQDCAKHNSDKSLEYNGFVCYELKELPDLSKYGLDEVETYNFINTLIKQIRDSTSIVIPDLVSPFTPCVYGPGELRPMLIDHDEGKGAVFLTKRVTAYISQIIGSDNVVRFSRHLFKKTGCMLHVSDGYRLKLDSLAVNRKPKRYYCSSCHKSVPFNCRNICLRCGTATLEEIPVNDDENNSYIKSYTTMELARLKVKEHTAQLKAKSARSYQQSFIDGEINALSCSTTFEMGVDIGALNTVFMRNMPPTPANYIQRAGRAGRGPDSSAFSVTFCKNSPHDSFYFNDPVRMISGNVAVPQIKPDNPKMAIRHIFASALSFFWKQNAMVPMGVMHEFREHVDEFYSWLHEHPKDLLEFLEKAIPAEIQDLKDSDTSPDDPTSIDIDLENFGWVRHLCDEKVGRMYDCISDYDETLKTLKDNDDGHNYYITQAIRLWQEENTLDFLSRKNIIPKYGFPVDLVELCPTRIYESNNLDLSRDLSMAISEYAPGSQIVADGKIITSQYLKKMPSKSLPRYLYKKCDNCNSITVKFDTGDAGNDITNCCSCGAELKQSSKRFIIPRYGFLYNSKDITDVVGSKPVRMYSSDVFYRGSPDGKIEETTLGNEPIQVSYSSNDELVVINENRLYICPLCGYGTNDPHIHSHRNTNGSECVGKIKSESLGHIFKTDVFIIKFPRLNKLEKKEGISVLYALIEGFCNEFDIDRREVSGCIKNDANGTLFILFDQTPGGAGYVKMLNDDNCQNIRRMINKALKIVKDCTCGSGDDDCACYSCLMNYSNQKYHDILSRGAAIRILSKLDVN